MPAPRNAHATPVLAALLLACVGCADYAYPSEFDAEREELQEEWEKICGDPCEGTEDDPAACGPPGDADSCAAYSLDDAKACIRAYKRVIRKEVCSPTHDDMAYLAKRCDAVYQKCGETDGETEGETEGETDTGGTETDTDGTETEGGSGTT
jgi:hypothetical protein